MKKFMAMVLAIIMCVSVFPFAIIAKTTTPEGNTWTGDDFKVDIKAGENGYVFRSMYENPGKAYEMSGHMMSVNGGVNNDIPQTLILVDASKDYTWTPNGIYSFGTSNYEVLYCCDAETGYKNDIYYKRMNLEDSTYYTVEDAAHIRAIVTNSYPYVSLEQMKASLAADGFEGAEKLTRAEVISAVQAAIWAYANVDAGTYKYSQSFNVCKNTQWGTVMHDCSAEMTAEIQALGKRGFVVDNESGARIDALVEHLKQIDKVYAEKNAIVISNLEIVDIAPVQAKAGVYTVAMQLALNNSGSSEMDNISIDIYVDDVLTSTVPVALDTVVYDLTVEAKANQKITAVVNGTQYLPLGVYFYEPEGGREVSQSLVGVAGGETSVYADASVTLDVPPEETPVTVDLVIRKIDESGKALSGATFALYTNKNDTGILVGQYEVNAQGIISIENLLAGDYVIKEIVTPAGYESLAGDISFTVSANGAINANSIPEGVRFSSADGAANIEVTNVKSKTYLGGVKYLDGEPAAGFTFELYEIIDGKEVYVASATSNLDGKFSFYVEYGTPATLHNYVIKEKDGGDVGIIYDDSVFEAMVFVDPMGVATVIYGEDVIFRNKTVSSAKVTISGEKYLDGKAADGFWFVLADAFGNEIERVQCANGKFTFSKLTFDSAGTYRYFVSELAGDDENIIYDNNIIKVEVKVKKNGNRYTASRSIIGAEKIAFYNETVPPTEFEFDGSKYLDGVPAEGFEFAILEGGDVISTATSDKNGKFYFTVDLPVVGDYNFQIVELAGDDEMIIYDDTVYDVNVEVVIENGTLVATSDDVEIVFNNQTVKPATVSFSGKNYLDLVLTGGFNFALKDGDKIIARASSDANGSFTLPELTFNRDGIYVYEFVEIAGDVDTIVYDESIYTLTIVVTLEGNELVADVTVDYLDKSNPFQNARGGVNSYVFEGLDFYNWTIRTNAKIEGTKYLDGKAAAGFDFALIDSENNVVATAQSDENGYFAFDLACNATGTFNYSVIEIAGNNANIIYDDSVIGVTVKVTRGDIELIAEVSTSSEVVFNNETVPEETTEIPEETTEIPEETTEIPEETTEVPEVTTEPEEEITEEPTPLDPTPETTEPEEEITEPEIPLNPKTGDTSILLVIAAIASIALAVLYFKRREVTED